MGTEHEDANRANPPPDPEPEATPGLEPGGGVPPGETPPESSAATRGLTPQEKSPRHGRSFLALVIVAILALAVAVLLIGQIIRLAS